MALKTYLFELATDRKKGFAARAVGGVLFLLSLLYGVCVTAVSFLQTRRRISLGCPVISCGNITVGGTGKTALVEYIVRHLFSAGRRPAVLTRGYKRFENVGDEAFMLSSKFSGLHILVDPDRLRSGFRAVRELGASVIVLDDGFQQWRLARDLDIVCIDCINGFGNRFLLPRGLLREPLSALRRSDVFFLSNTGSGGSGGIKSLLSRINPQAMIVESDHHLADPHRLGTLRAVPLASLEGVRVCLLSGIGNPVSFKLSAERAGMVCALCLDFPDHHRYTSDDLKKIAQGCRQEGIKLIVTTEKDEPRLAAAGPFEAGIEVLVAPAVLRIKGNEKEFIDRLDRIFNL